MIFAFHAYPWLIHRLTYRRTNHDNIHVRGYKEEGTITTPFDMTVLNELDRFHLAMDAIDRLPQTGERGLSVKRTAAGASWSSTSSTSTPTDRICRRSATGPGALEMNEKTLIDDRRRPHRQRQGSAGDGREQPTCNKRFAALASRRRPRCGARTAT